MIENLQLETVIKDAIDLSKRSVTTGTVNDNETTGGAGKSKRNNKNQDVAGIIAKVIETIQPVIIKAIAAAVTAAFSSLNAIQYPNGYVETEAPKLMKEIQLMKFQHDKMDMKLKMNNVRLYGVPENDTGNGEKTKEENGDEILKEIGHVCKVDITASDILSSYRIGRRNMQSKNPRPLLVKLAKKDTKIALLRGKKLLRNNPKYGKTFINEDLTRSRAKLFAYVRNGADSQSRVWTRDGVIHYLRKSSNNEDDVYLKIETPDDLFSLGWKQDEENITDLYNSYQISTKD